jgi:hypothetical protein
LRGGFCELRQRFAQRQSKAPDRVRCTPNRVIYPIGLRVLSHCADDLARSYSSSCNCDNADAVFRGVRQSGDLVRVGQIVRARMIIKRISAILMPDVRRLARRLHPNAIVLKPHVPGTSPNTSERDYWEERISAAQEAHFALSEFWRRRRDSS